MDARLNTKRILIFLAFVIVLPWMIVLAVRQSGMMESSPTSGMMLANYIIIFVPALGSIFTRLLTGEGWGKMWLRPNFRRGWRYYLAAWLLPLLAVTVGAAVFYLLYPQSFDPNLGEVRKVYAALPALAEQPWLGLLVTLFQIMVVAALINGVVSMGEELGWRAYLLPKLMTLFAGDAPEHALRGARRAALVTGLVWGVWHFPLFFLSSSLTLPFALSYLLFTCAVSVFLSWVTLRSGSAWTASLGHGMVNATAALPVMLRSGPSIALVGPEPTGLVGVIGYLILALVLLLHRRALGEQSDAGVVRAAGTAASRG